MQARQRLLFPRALVVDKHPVNRSILSKQLGILGIDVITCSSGAAALAQLELAPDLVLTDHYMPDMNGLELAEAIRAASHRMPILLLSSNPNHAKGDPARDAVHAVLQKPVPRSVLFDRLTALSLRSSQVVAPPPQLFTTTQTIGIGRQMQVLAAEDNKTNRLVLRRMSKKLNIELRFATDGRQAVEVCATFQPDLILMDISMPGVDGKEATNRFRKGEAETRSPCANRGTDSPSQPV